MKRLKQKKAFTIMELLIVVAIIVILLAISMPMVSGLTSDLKMKELDDYARTIYIEAQNQLVATRAEGGLDGLKGLMESSYSDQNLGEKPQDFDTEANGDSWRQLYYLNADDLLLSDVIPAGVSFDGSFLIELNPETGNVYGVFYREEDGAIDYANDIMTLTGRNVEARAPKGLGYFGGDIENTVQETFYMDQQLEVVNAEELYAVISYRISTVFARYYTTALETTLTAKGVESGAVWVCTVDTDSMKVNGDRMELYVLLDSMLPGYSLEEINGDDVNFKPGENLEITVKSTFKRGFISVAEESASVVNSLFASTYANGSENEITVNYVRHLRNLGKEYFDNTDGLIPKVIQGKDIDFATKEFGWESNVAGVVSYTGRASNPLDTFAPLENDTVFERSGASYVGNNNSLKNFVIHVPKEYSGNGVGIFQKIKGMQVSGVRIQDIQVTAAKTEEGSSENYAMSYVGTLAGIIENSRIADCGVYLSTVKQDGTYCSDHLYAEGIYANEMEMRSYMYMVSGGQYTGGFCGMAKNTEFTKCFAAVRVDGTYDVGGFCGRAEGSIIEGSTEYHTKLTDCYASGAVVADGRVGGIAGLVSGVEMTNCYSTSSIAAPGSAGGIAGTSSQSKYRSCVSYARLTGANGQGTPATSGAFLGLNNSLGDSFADCFYLEQEGWNTGLTEAAGIEDETWNDLKVTNEVSRSFPYNVTLVRKSFPFQMVTGSHYGDWPSQYVIDTSLAYYEVYKDNTYGYYCVTTMSDVAGDPTENFTWVLDTLKDEICVEDGYALLTLYNLESFDYMLNVGSVVSTDANYTANTSTGTLTISTEHGDGKAKLLRQQSALSFKGYRGTYAPETDFDTMPVEDMFTVVGMYLYQLPYDLQLTPRSTVDDDGDNSNNAYYKQSTFYDRLTVYNGIARNNSLGAVIGGENVTDPGAIIFYYCPYFAKNAINPGLGDTTQQKLANPAYVAVRSARQLNVLGRVAYYWNSLAGHFQGTLRFIQETDISFSDYVTTYCGRTFNLMDTSEDNPVRNRAIGQSKETKLKQFNNSYNGNGKKIIDYRLETTQQFAGFFGEVENGVIENIFMTVSEPYDPTNPDSKGGYIHSRYNDASNAAAGAVVGLSYHHKNIVRNCAASGYEIKYMGTMAEGEVELRLDGISLGGLVGVSMSQIENCSAVCDVRVELNGPMKRSSGKGGSISLGGLVGTAFFMEIKDSYSGGTIDIDATDAAYIDNVNDLALGGIAGAILKIYHDNNLNVSPVTNYKDLYTYTRILAGSEFNEESIGGRFFIAPIVAKEILSVRDHHNKNPKIKADQVIITNCYYLDTAFNGIQDEGEDGAERIFTNVYGATRVTYAELADLTLHSMGPVNDAAHTFPVSASLQGKTYNLPATVKDSYGQYVHFGDWPYQVVPRTLSKVYPGYYEVYEDGTVGSYYIDVNGNTRSSLRNDLEIVDAGYANLKLEAPANPDEILGTVTLAGMTYYICEDEAIEAPYQDGYPGGKKKIENCTTMNVDYEVVQVVDGVIQEGAPTIVTKTLYVNPNFGASISLDSNLGKVVEDPLQVRTVEQLLNLNKLDNGWQWNRPISVYIKQTKDLDLSDLTSSIVVGQHVDYDGGRGEGFRVLDAKVTVFEDVIGYLHDVWSIGNKKTFINRTAGGSVVEDCFIEGATIIDTESKAIFALYNQGTMKNNYIKNSSYAVAGLNGSGFINVNDDEGIIQNCGIYSDTAYSGSTVSGNQAVGFVWSNGGTIRNCFTNCTMSTCNYTAGFVQVNSAGGLIENCYANCHGYAEGAGAVAYGFVESNKGTIRNCYSAGLAKSSSTNHNLHVYGFGVNSDGGSMENCYSVCELVSLQGELYGFGNHGNVTNCYWGYSNRINIGLDASLSSGTRKTLAEIAAMTSIGTLKNNAVTDAPYDKSLGSNYPYPGVVGQVHYGDWPKAEGVSNRNSYIRPSGQFVGVFYYEKYNDGTYGIFAKGVDEMNCIWNPIPNTTFPTVNTLAEPEEAVATSGFGVFYSEASNAGKWKVEDENGNPVTLDQAGSGLGIRVSGYCFRILENGSTDFTKELSYSSDYTGGGGSRSFTLTKTEMDATRP